MVLKSWRKLRERLGTGIFARALFSLALALLLWSWVTSLDDPETDRVIGPIAPALVDRPASLVILDEGNLPGVTVTLRGPRSLLNALTPNDLHINLDLGEAREPGTVDLAVAVTTPRGVRITNISPSRIALSVDQLTTKSFALDVEKGASLPPYSVGTVDTATKRVDVKGPSTLVNRVDRVVLPIGLGDHRETFEGQFIPEARDNTGARVNGVTIEPANVTAAVAVERVGRTVSIVPNIQGVPADGFRVTGTSVGPPTITVDGPADVLAQMIVVSTIPIDVTGRTESFSFYDVALALPPGTRLLDRTPINVEVRIDAEQQKQQIGGVRVNVTGLDPSLRATITPPEIAVTLSGSRDRLRQLQGSDVQVAVDLSGRAPGVYTIVPTVSVPADLRYETPAAVRVQIERIASPTIQPTVTPTPRPTPIPTPVPTPGQPVITPTVSQPLEPGRDERG